MSNGMSGTTQFIDNYYQDLKDNIRESRRIAFDNYIEDYIKKTSVKRCTCSGCKAENAIHPTRIIRVSQGVQEFWKCDCCGRTVPRLISNEELGYRLNVDRQRN